MLLRPCRHCRCPVFYDINDFWHHDCQHPAHDHVCEPDQRLAATYEGERNE